MLRIVAGELGGRRLRAPAGMGTRPTSEKVREALFAILGGWLVDKRAADFFAGSGALGLEALSRGAAWCLFVEHSHKVGRVLRSNLDHLEVQERSQLEVTDALRPDRRVLELAPFDLVLADPPYERGLVSRFMRTCRDEELVAPGGKLVIEHSPAERPPESSRLKLTDQRRYGQTELSFLESLA